MKAYSGEKHKKGGKHDGHKATDRLGERDKKTPPKYETFDGKPTE